MHSVCIINYDVEEPERQIEITPTPNLMLSKITHYNILDPSCKKSCDLIGQEQVSISHINL